MPTPAPRLTDSLHFRLSALFMGLIALLAIGYYFWINSTVFRVERAPGEEKWYDELVHAELDSLARLLRGREPAPADLDSILVRYGPRVERFGAELSLLSATGMILSSTRPNSPSRELLHVSPALLDSMARPGWDFESYPSSYDINAFENRIVALAPVRAGTDTTSRVTGWLVGSVRPLSIEEGEVESTERRLAAQAAVVMLIFLVSSAIIVMAWVSRPLRRLSVVVAAFREGEFDRRVASRSADEIGNLSRDFNAMADRISALIDQLRQSEEFHRQLVANMSHDLRTPLASLRGYVEMLGMRGDALPAAERARYLSVLESNVEVLENLIGRMLELSRLDAGRTEFRREEFQLTELCHDLLERSATIAAARNVTLHCAPPEDLPPVYADALRIGQVLQNLVENGIKFNRPGGSVTVAATVLPGAVQIEVRDTGRGIAPEHLPHIFDRFFTADPSRGGDCPGSGLGLAIASRILAGHGSRLEVESRPGEGTAFRFQLPIAPVAGPDAPDDPVGT